MPDVRYPTHDEFWKRLDKRNVEPDLKNELERRAGQTDGQVQRVGRGNTVIAVVERLLPGSDVPSSVLAAFLDANFDKQLGRGDERAGMMPRSELIPAGFAALDDAAGADFAALPPEAQDVLLQRAESGKIQGPASFDSSLWFKRIRDIILLAHASDPRGMVQMGYPGPSYQPGHLWLGPSGIEARLKRRPGYLEL